MVQGLKFFSNQKKFHLILVILSIKGSLINKKSNIDTRNKEVILKVFHFDGIKNFSLDAILVI